jgi:hypothetical protein
MAGSYWVGLHWDMAQIELFGELSLATWRFIRKTLLNDKGGQKGGHD